MRSDEETEQVSYICNICAQSFTNQGEFLQHHVAPDGKSFDCCKCRMKYKTMIQLYSHFDDHTAEVVISEGEEHVDEIVLNYENEEETSATNELLYVLDDSQCVNEIVIEQGVSAPPNKTKKIDNYTLVQLEHGYVIPSATDEEVTEHTVEFEKITSPKILQPSTSKPVPHSKPRTLQAKRRHVVPDFSAANYVFVDAGEEIDIPHYKCLRCEQLFINKFVFFRHIEKGKCYINNCDVCSATFEKNSEFYYHYSVEHSDRAICNFCFRTFMYEKNVKEHMMRHLDQFRHRCDECNKGFYTVREYRNHYKNRHMGIRHKCNICDRTFADEYYFKRHMATHDPVPEQIILE